MPSYDYVGNAMKSAGYPAFQYPGSAGTGPTSSGPYSQTSPLGSAYQAEPFNLGESGNLTQLSDLINSINRGAQTQNLQARIPNNPALEQQSSANIGSELKGQLPVDVTNLLGEQGAERGVGRGLGPDSANANAAYLRALGLTSLQEEQTGQQNLTAADARNPAAPIFNTASQLISPLDLAKIQEQGLGLNATIQNQLAQQSLAQQRLNQQAYQYANPQLGYGGYGNTLGTGTNPITGADVLPTDTSTGTYGGSYAFNQSPTPLGNAYDFNPTTSFPDDYGNPVYGSPDYATTPASVYG